MTHVTLLSALAGAAFKKMGAERTQTTAKAIDDNSGVARMTSRSLLELGRVTEVEAITVVDSSLTMHESTTAVLKFANTLYASWYLSAAAVLTDTGRVRTVDLLAKLNPSKSPTYAVASTILSTAQKVIGASMESVELVDPSMVLGETRRLPRTTNDVSVSLENAQAKAEGAKVTGAKNANDLVAVSTLSIGQAITLNVTDGKHSKDVVVNVRLVTVPTNYSLLSTILKWSNKDNRLKSRISAWRAGELSFWRDVVLMRDVFTERQRLLMSDKSDLIKTLLGRQRDSMINSVLTSTPDVGNLSSILVISEENLRRAEEEELDGKLSNFNYRQRVMNNTGLVLIIVVDPLSEFVTIYNHLNALPTECSISQMKAAGKGGANDFAEIIKLMNQNKLPSF